MSKGLYAELQTKFWEELDYDPKTGRMAWKKSGRGRFKRAGALAGGMRPDGYLSICVDGEQWLLHRVAWVMSYGSEPPAVIDHINRNKGDNRIENLRDGTNGVNGINAKAHKDSPFGIAGVRPASKAGNFQAYVATRGGFKSFYHGPDFFEACCARKSWEAKFFRGAA